MGSQVIENGTDIKWDNRFDQLYRRTANELNQLVGQESKRFLNIIDAGASAFNNLILGKDDDVKDVVFGEC